MTHQDHTLEQPNTPEFSGAEQVMSATALEIGTLSVAESYESGRDKECLIDGVLFDMNGRLKTEDREAYGFTTTDPEGNSRLMFVYRSDSEGVFRVALGIAHEGTVTGAYIKGDRSNPLHQYTQDTQLHPDFAEAMPKMITALGQSKPNVNPVRYYKNAPAYEEITRDFSEQMQTTHFPDTTLSEVLQLVAQDTLEEYTLAEILDDVLLKDLPDMLEKHVGKINAALEASGAIPAFDEPERVEHDHHALLGDIVREVYRSEMQGTTYEWYMASDSEGRVWIDRIREADSPATVYGTDKRVVYSGILTLKPFDYTGQVDGIPTELRVDDPTNDYSDITKFIDTFLPVQRYRKARAIFRTTDV